MPDRFDFFGFLFTPALIYQQGSNSAIKNISVIITIKTYGRINRIAQRWRNWFGAA